MGQDGVKKLRMKTYYLSMWVEEPIRCKDCGEILGWERLSCEHTPIKIVPELLHQNLILKEGESAEITLSDADLHNIRVYFSYIKSWHTWDIYRMYNYKNAHPYCRIRAKITPAKTRLAEKPAFHKIYRSGLVIISLIILLIVMLQLDPDFAYIMLTTLAGFMSVMVAIKAIAFFQEAKLITNFGTQRLTLCVDRNIECKHCGSESNHQYDLQASISWTRSQEIDQIKRKIRKISATKRIYGILDRRDEQKELSYEDVETLKTLQQAFPSKDKEEKTQMLTVIESMIKNNECSTYLVFDEEASKLE